MGYCMTQRDSDFIIKKKNFDDALNAMKEMCIDKPDYAWVYNSKVLEAKTLQEALAEWRWEVIVDDDGDINCIYFYGEKLGDDEALFTAIAPYVEADSYIEMGGEDGALWRWCFANKKLIEQSAQIIWE